MKKGAGFLVVLLMVLALSCSVWAKGGGGFSGGGRSFSSSSFSRSSFSSGVRSYTPPARPYSAPITKMATVSTPAAAARPVRIVPVSRPATVINKTVINKTVVNNHGGGGGYYGGGDHFWSNWMMFSLLSNHSQPQTVVVAGQPVAQQGTQVYPATTRQEESASSWGAWLCFLAVLGCVVAGLFWLKKNAVHGVPK